MQHPETVQITMTTSAEVLYVVTCICLFDGLQDWLKVDILGKACIGATRLIV